MHRLRAEPDVLDPEQVTAAYAYPAGPWLRANMVASADGAAMANGRTAGLSGPADQWLLGLLRGLADAVLVGSRTVQVEGYGPARTRPETAAARRAAGQSPAPRLAVVSATLGLDPQAPLFTAATEPTLVLTTGTAPAARRRDLARVAEVVVAGDAVVDLAAAVAALHERGLTRLLCEGGPRLLAGVVAADLLDELCLTVSPRLLGGPAARILDGPSLPSARPLRLAGVLAAEEFLFLRYHRAPSPEATQP